MAKKKDEERQRIDPGVAAIIQDYEARDEERAWQRMTPAERERERRKIDRTSVTLRLNTKVAAALEELSKGFGISKASAADMLMHHAILHFDQIDLTDYLEESRSSRWLWRVRPPGEGLLESVREILRQGGS